MSDTTQAPPAEPIRVPSVLAMMIEQLAMIAWAKLGLQPDPITGKIEANMVDAKLAIDSVGDLVHRLQPEVDAEDKRQLDNLLRDLRINYVNRSGSE